MDEVLKGKPKIWSGQPLEGFDGYFLGIKVILRKFPLTSIRVGETRIWTDNDVRRIIRWFV